MASVLKAQKKNQSVKDSKGKRKADAMDIDDDNDDRDNDRTIGLICGYVPI